MVRLRSIGQQARLLTETCRHSDGLNASTNGTAHPAMTRSRPRNFHSRGPNRNDIPGVVWIIVQSVMSTIVTGISFMSGATQPGYSADDAGWPY